MVLMSIQNSQIKIIEFVLNNKILKDLTKIIIEYVFDNYFHQFLEMYDEIYFTLYCGQVVIYRPQMKLEILQNPINDIYEPILLEKYPKIEILSNVSGISEGVEVYKKLVYNNGGFKFVTYFNKYHKQYQMNSDYYEICIRGDHILLLYYMESVGRRTWIEKGDFIIVSGKNIFGYSDRIYILGDKSRDIIRCDMDKGIGNSKMGNELEIKKSSPKNNRIFVNTENIFVCHFETQKMEVHIFTIEEEVIDIINYEVKGGQVIKDIMIEDNILYVLTNLGIHYVKIF